MSTVSFDVVVMQETKDGEARMDVETTVKVQNELKALYKD